MAVMRLWTLCANKRRGLEGAPMVLNGPRIDLYDQIEVVPEAEVERWCSAYQDEVREVERLRDELAQRKREWEALKAAFVARVDRLEREPWGPRAAQTDDYWKGWRDAIDAVREDTADE